MKPKFTFIDLFAGIGGFRIALERLGGKCVFSSEWDKHAKETYYQNYGEVPFGDITNFTKTDTDVSIKTDNIPDHDILCGGFPCQPFSQAGRQLGFEDARGTLFFDILTIAKIHRPKVLFLENVKRLRGHDKGKTFAVICNALKEIGYKVYSKVVSAYDQGVPQNRERIFIVAFSQPIHFEFPKNNRHSIYSKVGDILEKRVDSQFTISDKLWAGHQRRLREHRERGNGFGYSLFDEESQYVNTISARYWKDGSEILIDQKNNNPRILTPRECARIQGYPEDFKYHDSKRHSYQQFGNSVAVPVIEAISRNIFSALDSPKQSSNTLLPLEPVCL
ncbi:DNA cytosine methyltransferase [Pelagicoccus albus]|uniref:Cytosine-specific methyltransferase n=2 Tax=Pelagicoccus albus TaxID=415222 RepID=A0A7X1B895_9BACT|nr:DNA cytosine methyltransferase [Pelagicoccus albus]